MKTLTTLSRWHFYVGLIAGLTVCTYFFINRIPGYFFSSSTVDMIACVPFDVSMNRALFAQKLKDPQSQYIYDFFKTLYEKNSPQNIVQSRNVKIPRIIHIIWLGSKLPNIYESYVASWYTYHPEWTIIFWTDSSKNFNKGERVVTSFDEVEMALAQREKRLVVDVRNLYFSNRSYYICSKNYGERSDILRYEIVYRLGGLYVDTDYECLRSFDALHYCYDFYTGMQPLDTAFVQLGAALFGAIPGHPILKRCIESIKENQNIPQIIARTGPLHFTRCFINEADRGFVDVAFPASYFYPCSYEQRGLPKEKWVKKEAYAVHHWAGSWLNAKI